jgi:hypothetical protein
MSMRQMTPPVPWIDPVRATKSAASEALTRRRKAAEKTVRRAVETNRKTLIEREGVEERRSVGSSGSGQPGQEELT